MATAAEQRIARKIRAINHQVARERIIGVTGRPNDDNSITVKDPNAPGNIFVRIGGYSGDVKSVVNKKTGADRLANLEVELDYNSKGILEVVGISAVQDALPPELRSSYESPSVAGGTKQDTTPNALISNLRVRVQSGMTAFIEAGYYYIGATEYHWSGGPLDLTAYVAGTTGMKAPVIIGLDSATNTAVAYKGAEVVQSLLPVGSPYFTGTDFAAARNAATGFDAALFGIGLLYGQTAITNQADFVDLRAEQVNGNASVGGSLAVTDGSTTVTDVTEIDVVGGTVADLGSGIAEITITGGGGGASELGYAEVTSADTKSGITPSDITGLGVTVTVVADPVLIEVWFGYVGLDSGSNSRINFRLLEDGSAVCNAYCAFTNTVTIIPATMKKRRSPGAGSHTYQVQWSIDDGSGTGAFYADANAAAFIRVTS